MSLNVRRKKPFHRLLENYTHPDLFGHWLGYEIIKTNSKKWIAEAELTIRKDHLSPAGRVHGGVISAFFDWACGCAVFLSMGPKDYCSTVEIKINYFKPILLGDVIEAKTQVHFRGKRLCVVHGFAYKKNEKTPVAMATATFNIISPEPSSKRRLR